MAKMIDKQVMLNLIIDAKRNEPENVSSFSEWLAEYLTEHLPTLTPPSNEPLTLEQLREMDGEPVFLVFMQPIEYGWEDQWALVDSENETVFNSAYKFDSSNCVGFAYRRPPEGEEDI